MSREETLTASNVLVIACSLRNAPCHANPRGGSAPLNDIVILAMARMTT
jgi:hypothetical protein